MKSKFLIIVAIVCTTTIVLGMSIVSLSINDFDDFVYQLKEPFDGPEREEIAEYEPETKNMECIPTDYEKTRKCLAAYHCSVDNNPELNKECIETHKDISIREMCSNPDNIIIQQTNGCMILPLVGSKHCGSSFASCQSP